MRQEEESIKILVAQLGARMHYAVPRILHETGLLHSLHTDICAVKGWPRIAKHIVPKRLRTAAMERLFGRVPAGIPPSKIYTCTTLGWKWARQLQRATTPSEKICVYLQTGREFCLSIIRSRLNGADVVYTFNAAGLELLEEAKHRGLYAVIEQTSAPKNIEVRILMEEYDRFPDLEGYRRVDSYWQDFYEREQREWSVADLILCGSQFVVDRIHETGGPVEKARVVPYGVDFDTSPTRLPKDFKKEGISVLFVGGVGLQKGAHYLIEAARLLQHENIRFRLVGPIQLKLEALGKLPENVELIGPVPRAEIKAHYKWADIFCLPSLCEGSATVIYEAMAMGLPVITTPNSGSIVQDGVDGFIVPIRAPERLAEAILRCKGQPFQHLYNRHHDPNGPPTYSFAAYKQRLVQAVLEAYA